MTYEPVTFITLAERSVCTQWRCWIVNSPLNQQKSSTICYRNHRHLRSRACLVSDEWYWTQTPREGFMTARWIRRECPWRLREGFDSSPRSIRSSRQRHGVFMKSLHTLHNVLAAGPFHGWFVKAPWAHHGCFAVHSSKSTETTRKRRGAFSGSTSFVK